MESNLVALIKRAAMEAFEASKPCTTCIGQVKRVSPLRVSLDQKKVLDEDFLEVTSTAKEKLKKGSSVLLIRQAGGQKYSVIDTLE